MPHKRRLRRDGIRRRPLLAFVPPRPCRINYGRVAWLRCNWNAPKRDEQKAAAAQQLQAVAAAEQLQAAAANTNKAASEKSADEPDPKRREINRQDKHVQRVQHQAHRLSVTPKNAPVESMALDDSSDDDDSDEE